MCNFSDSRLAEPVYQERLNSLEVEYLFYTNAQDRMTISQQYEIAQQRHISTGRREVFPKTG